MKKYFLIACLFFIGLFAPLTANAASIGLTWDTNPEPDMLEYRIYQSNGVSQAVIFNTVTHPTNVTHFSNIVANVNYTFWATAVNQALLESFPSATVSYYLPSGVPPSVVLNKPLFGSFSEGAWQNVQFTWTPSPTEFKTTNYVVSIRNVASSAVQNFNTPTANFTFATIPHDDWTITVAAQNQLGSSVIATSSTYNLSKKRPNAVLNLKFQ